jgi:hypothetical protein
MHSYALVAHGDDLAVLQPSLQTGTNPESSIARVNVPDPLDTLRPA